MKTIVEKLTEKVMSIINGMLGIPQKKD